jgi:cytochrome bd-type quinol oxidase subunit 2
MSNSKPPAALDKAGAIASFACAIHCAIMPMIITLLPLVGLSIFASEPVEWILFAISAVLGSCSICWGYKSHRSRKVLAILACGLAFLSVGRIMHSHHTVAAESDVYSAKNNPQTVPSMYTVFLVLGGVCVAASHVVNRRMCNQCKVCAAK